jgi:hypothetical protein
MFFLPTQPHLKESYMNASTQLDNGRPQRKLLAEQLDRLDQIIDGLVEGLPEAVAAAAREGTRLAVKDAILEVMTNPDLRAVFQNPQPSVSMQGDVASKPSLWTRIKAGIAMAKAGVVERVHAVKRAAGRVCRHLTALPWKRTAVTTATVVLAAGAAAYFAPAIGLSSFVASIGCAVAAVTAHVGAWLRRSARTLFATA